MSRRKFTSGRKFSTTTSALFASRRKISTPCACLRSRVMLRLLRCRFWKSGPSRGPPIWPSSSGISILMTSAPQSASWRTQVGPARTRVRSSTLKRASAWLAGGRDIGGSVELTAGRTGLLYRISLRLSWPSRDRRHLGGIDGEHRGVPHRVDVERWRGHLEPERAVCRRHHVVPELAQVCALDDRHGDLRTGAFRASTREL